MFAVIGACVVLASGFQFSNGQDKTYCEQKLIVLPVSQEGNHCFFVVTVTPPAMLKPKPQYNGLEFVKSVAEQECAKHAAHLPKLSNESMTAAERKAFYELADKMYPKTHTGHDIWWPTSCIITDVSAKEKSVTLDCGLGIQRPMPQDNLFNDGKEWLHDEPVCLHNSTVCTTFYIANNGFATVNFTSHSITENDTVPLMCHQLKSATSSSTSLTSNGPPATSGPTSAPTESSGGTANTNGFGSKMVALVVTVAVFKM